MVGPKFVVIGWVIVLDFDDRGEGRGSLGLIFSLNVLNGTAID